MIVCEQVAYAVASTGGEVRTILHPLSFASEAGTVTLIRGESGAGKSTLISILSGMLRPTEGQVSFQGQPVSRYTAAHRDRFRRNVGLVPQRFHLFEGLTPLENVLLPSAPRHPDQNLSDRAIHLLETLEVPPLQALHTLSGGEQQRTAIARSLVARPNLLVLDEPTAHQDDRRIDTIVTLIRSTLPRSCTVVIAAHDPRLERRMQPTTTLALREGRLVAT